jgi:hypothetical protein
MRFFFGGGFGGLCALLLFSDRTSGAETLCLSFLLNRENTGRLFGSGGGELLGAGEDGGEEGVRASEKVGSDGWGLEVRGAELMRVGDRGPIGDLGTGVVEVVGSVFASSTRLRLIGGSSL